MKSDALSNPGSQAADIPGENLPGNEEPDNKRSDNADHISLPRWIVYFQAALLGIIATTFFVLGMLVGNFTAGNDSAAERLETIVSGQVTYDDNGNVKPDADAVVLLLPRGRRPDERSKAELIHPLTFQPLDNTGIDRVHALGGAVVRVSADGRFRVVVDGPQTFQLLIISRNQARPANVELTREQRGAIADFFFPVEAAFGDRKVHSTEINADREQLQIPTVQF